MHDRFTARHSRRRSGRRRSTRSLAVGWIAALTATVPVIGFGFYLAQRPASHLVTSADVQTAQGQDGQAGMRGWGRGGFPMMPGSASSGSGSSGPALGPVNAAATSSNWAGYAATGQPGTLTSVSASWSQPAVDCGNAAQTFSAFWVGLDGDGTPTVEQTGTEADCANGAATYQGWYEIFPDPPVFYNNPVQPADTMGAWVTSDGNGVFTLTLTDTTQGWTQTTQQSEPNAQLGSAEIIAEAPSNGQQVLPLANFGAVNFANATAGNQPLGNEGQNLTAITMASGGTALATPSALSGGNAFSVSWDSSGSAVGAAQGDGGTGNGQGSQGWIWSYPAAGDPGLGDAGGPGQAGTWWSPGY